MKDIIIALEILYGGSLVALSQEFIEKIHESVFGRVVVGRWYREDLTLNDLIAYLTETSLVLINRELSFYGQTKEDAITFTLDRIYTHMKIEKNIGDRVYIGRLLQHFYQTIYQELSLIGVLQNKDVGTISFFTVKNKLIYLSVKKVYSIGEG